MTAGSTAAQAAVWTDQADYQPGSVVTFNGDNSDGAGYLAGETVHVAVNQPNGSTQSCDATADSTGAWSCQITLAPGDGSIGEYDYTATGQTSGVSQSGTFTDSNCKDASALGTELKDPLVSASFTTSGGTATYSVSSPNRSPSGGIPGLIEYCVYPSSFPTSGTALYDSWTFDNNSSHGYFAFARPGGDSTNLPFDGTSRTVGTATWSGAVPGSQTIVLHINDPTECSKLYGSGTLTCFVLPSTNQDLTVTKTATPSFTRTFAWGITKTVDKTQQNIPAGSSATFNYTVGVTHDGGTDSAWQVTGKITVSNPNSVDFTGVAVTDASNNGGNCAVTNGTNVKVPAGGSAVLDYTCTYSSAPSPLSGMDTATATWSKAAYGTPDGSASGTATADFSTATPTIVDGSVTVGDTLGGSLGTVSYTDLSPTTFKYPYTFTGDPPGTCTLHNNTATFTTNTSGQTGSASQSVTVCVGADLTVKKDATPSFTRAYTWGITKTVDKTHQNIPAGSSATFNYRVAVTHDSGTDSNWQVNGTITVTNPNDWESVPLTGVTDSINNGGACAITSGNPTQTIAPKGTATLGYQCTYASAPSPASGTNTATATWNATAASTPDGTANGTATADFGSTTPTIVDGSVTVTDTLGGTLGTVNYNDANNPTTFKYPYTFTGDSPGTCTLHNNTATFTTNTSGQTGSASQSVTVCVGADLTVTKIATPSFTRSFTWGISKSVDTTQQNIPAGSSATFNYKVAVTHDSGTDGNWQVNGTITVTNPNDWESVPLTGVADKIDNGGLCTITSGDPTQILAPKGTATLGYQCTYTSAPSPAKGTNTATATWDATAASTPDGTASGTATADFSATAPTIVDGSVTVSDTLGGSLGKVSYTDASPKDFTYPFTFSGDAAGTCTPHNNTATFTTSDTGKTGTAVQGVTVCVGADLTVSKTATPSFTRTYNWNITKKVTPTLIEQTGGGTASASYTVTVSQTGFTDGGWQVSGNITVTNPNDWEAVTANVADAIDNNGTCTVSGGTSVTVPANKSVVLPYTCTYTSAPSPSSGTNTGTATWSSSAASTPDGSATGTKSYAFTTPTSLINQKITPVDAFNGGANTQVCTLATGTPCTLTATDSTPFKSQVYTYSRTLNVPSFNCVTYPNMASIVETGQTASASVEACGPAKTGALTMGFWQNKNGQAIITGGASTSGVCNSGTWLRQYAPFQDLSATATCAQVATYVSNLIKVANASGASMNAMLKAQMLATALDEYFSTPSLGSNKINAPAPVGGVSIDLTKVCAMIDSSNGTATCSGSYENVSSAFGGATSMTISQMLAYAASKSNVGGTNWYGQVKATQALAKDAFDAINNQAAFSP